MRVASVICICCLLAAMPASSEIVIAGDSDFGVSQRAALACEEQTEPTVGCYSDMLEPTLKAEGPRISVSGEARMGLVYDGESVRPRSKVSITISVGTVTDGGLHINGSTELSSVQ